MISRTFAALLMICALPALAEVKIDPPATATLDEGLAAWSRIYEVVSHPRCANCHTGPSDVPMWSGLSYGAARPHGMNIRAGESRIGAEFMPCQACHTTAAEVREDANATPHAAPRVAASWQLAPVEAWWFGRTSPQICAQLRDPDQNGGRDFVALAEHLGHDVILHWAWNPGGNREPAPYSLQEHVDDLLIWGVAGMPCPQD
jgi:hypothetical protein